jgi:hypothetical protein
MLAICMSTSYYVFVWGYAIAYGGILLAVRPFEDAIVRTRPHLQLQALPGTEGVCDGGHHVRLGFWRLLLCPTFPLDGQPRQQEFARRGV